LPRRPTRRRIRRRRKQNPHSRSPADLRAETVEDDSRFLGDDTMTLLIQSQDADALYRIQVNPVGAAHHAQVMPAWDVGWSPEVVIRTQSEQRQWRMMMAIPWDAIGWQAAPRAGESMRFNIAADRSIAPRVMASWHYLTSPFDPETCLGRGTVR